MLQFFIIRSMTLLHLLDLEVYLFKIICLSRFCGWFCVSSAFFSHLLQYPIFQSLQFMRHFLHFIRELFLHIFQKYLSLSQNNSYLFNFQWMSMSIFTSLFQSPTIITHPCLQILNFGKFVVKQLKIISLLLILLIFSLSVLLKQPNNLPQAAHLHLHALDPRLQPQQSFGEEFFNPRTDVR